MRRFLVLTGLATFGALILGGWMAALIIGVLTAMFTSPGED